MITLPVADVPAARAFYERLGWTVTATDLTDVTKVAVTSPPVTVNPGPASVLVMQFEKPGNAGVVLWPSVPPVGLL